MPQGMIVQATGLVNAYIIPLGWKLLGAVVVWIVGGWIVRLLRAALSRTLTAQHVDRTLAS